MKIFYLWDWQEVFARIKLMSLLIAGKKIVIVAESLVLRVLKRADLTSCATPLFEKHGMDYCAVPLQTNTLIGKDNQEQRARDLAERIRKKLNHKVSLEVCCVVVLLPSGDIPKNWSQSEYDDFAKRCKTFFYAFYGSFKPRLDVVVGGFQVCEGRSKVVKRSSIELLKRLECSKYFPGCEKRMKFVDICSPIVPYESRVFDESRASLDWQTVTIMGCILIGKGLVLEKVV